MNTKLTFRFLLLLACLLLYNNLQAITIHVETAGTLPSLIAESEKYEITELTLTGNLDSRDIRFIREMAGRSYFGDVTNGKLAVLDLADANIISYKPIDSSDSENSAYFCYPVHYPLYYAYYFTRDSTISEYMFYRCNNLTTIIIPNSTKLINIYGFQSCTGLTSIIIPNSVTSIGFSAFRSCTGLTEIHSKNSIPPACPSESIDWYSAFLGVNHEICKLYVPKNAKPAYQSAPGWKLFANIIEEDLTALPTINSNEIIVQPISGALTVKTVSLTLVTIYTVSGRKVYQASVNGETNIPLNQGIYIVQARNQSQKVIVR